MIGDYSIMDLATFLTVIIALAGVIGGILKNSRDTQAILREFTAQTKEHGGLQEKISSEGQAITTRTESIKGDTKYLKEAMLEEKWARKSLYQNTSRAKEILETIDIMEEVVHQNAALNAEVANLKVKNHELNRKQDDKSSNLLSAISRFEQKLGEFEMYGESEEIRSILKHIRNELSEYID
ncbi:hypothetical protein DDV21_001065 [Streptococcus chenjunshii]|uniref:Uncharacterized protein n=1 Tax=Streptococcus chenjunshii TaxID=2173853 RepID=A0A372KK77_9STRE|nr:hypothetical protein [Streptococcus chenjunshii]AXQ77761.1 hypothetical protein DDV21_001065 [Streptococcus chenjunshii]RFU50483.1 hypothetical protein DDV22_08400 [Streptococcus chenjunshii]RFU52711.1 hypothetical protein DDV23_08240 [Streptococcus chenjunshii]